MTAFPDTWQWREGPRSEPAGSGGTAEPAGSGGTAEPAGSGGTAEAPCVIVDIDGVLADGAHRQHLVKAKRWREFFDAAHGDAPIAETAVLLRLLDADLVVVLLTGRPVRTRQATITWLAEHGYRWDLLVMKENTDLRRTDRAKREAAAALRARGFIPVLALDDEPGNVEMYRAEGIPCLYIHSGYYE